MEIENLPEDCKQSLVDIERTIASAGKLTDVLSIAPNLVAPRPFGITKASSLLWALAKGYYDYRERAPKVKALLDPIKRNRIGQIIELEILRHESGNNRELVAHWRRMLEIYGE
jgi:hypothetical protein